MMLPHENALSAYARRVYSQNGEDGVLERIFDVLGVETGYCVDVGAHDGVYLSNTHHLLRNRRWSGVLIELDAARFRKLVANTQDLAGVVCLRAKVALTGDDTLDGILARAGAPREPELLSIDVDGVDYHIWESLERHRPRVVVIEYNPSIPNAVDYVQPADPEVSHGSSIRALVELGRAKGYEAAYATETNVVFVRAEVLAALGVGDNALDRLRDDRATTTYLFQGFDGTILLDGPQELFWQHVPIDVEDLQIVPKPLRRYQGSLPPRWRAVRAVWIAWQLGKRRRHWPALRDKVVRGLTGKARPTRSF